MNPSSWLTASLSSLDTTEQVDQGLRLVFGVCAVLAVVGVLWTWFLVDDKPHDSLTRANSEWGDTESVGDQSEPDYRLTTNHL